MATRVQAQPAAILDREELAAFRTGLRGQALISGDPGYDDARRVWNAMIDRRPGMIVRCAGSADVISAVNLARERGLLVSVKGGGHNVAGTAVCEGGVMIDVSPMKGVRVDPGGRTAWAQSGVTWGELDHETQAFGLATTGGMVSHTGIAGLTLGGGIGWLMRSCGLVSDNLLSVDLVTADGSFVTASASEHEELFWGLRGGGGNFGVATSFEYRLRPLGPIVAGGLVLHPVDRAPEVLRWYREMAASAPDRLAVVAAFMCAPPAPFVPQDLHFAPVLAICACYAGELDEGLRALAPLREFGPPVVDVIGPMPYTAVQRMFDDAVPYGRLQVYLKGGRLPELSDQVVDTMVARMGMATSRNTVLVVLPHGGAVGRVAQGETAWGHRDALFEYELYAMWEEAEEAERHVTWTRDFWTAMRPFETGVYVNALGVEGEDRVRDAYKPATYERLVALKNDYDPSNLFRHNQNIRPTV
jgi:hypothetical protein